MAMNKMARLTIALAAALPLFGVASEGTAQSNYPTRPVRMLVGFAPAGPADMIARLVGDKLSETWGQPVLIENATGAAANVAGDRAAKAAPDGYTLLMASNAQIVVNPSLYEKMSFDPAKDLVTISQSVFTPNLLVVHNDVPAKTVQELVAYARAQTGKLTYASAGVGTTQHLAAELFKSMAKVDIQHVPYRGATPAITDLLGGRVTMFFGNIAPLVPLVRDGKLRALAVTSAKRFGAVPDLPTMIEAGFPGFEAVAAFGLMAPAGTPQAVINKVHLDHVKALAPADIRKRLSDIGMEVIASSPAEFAAALAAERPQWTKLIKEAGIKSGD
jgi:tripartite-type tricarboxylate transporter receptor subunit TctC